MILENQAKQLVTEISQDGGLPTPGAVGNSFNTQAGAGAQWAGIALPLVRKTSDIRSDLLLRNSFLYSQ